MIAFTGDLYLGSQTIEIEDVILNQLNKSKFIVINFENVLKNDTYKKREDKASNLQFSKDSFDNYLDKINSKVIFTLGNNHMHDLGQEGVESTLHFLNNYKEIEITGIGLYDDIIRPLVIEDNDEKIAILCVSTDEPEVMSILATNKIKGALDYNDNIVFDIVEEYKKFVDYFVIIPHWGREYLDYPSIQQRKKAYKWIDAGADLIIGHHSHVIQGKENYNGKWIYYSLGNFIFPNSYNKEGILHTWENDNNKSIVLQIEFTKDINIEEFGICFEPNKNTLDVSLEANQQIISKSSKLDLVEYPIKKYFGIWQNNFYKRLRKEYSVRSRLKRFFPTHKNYGTLGYMFHRIKRKYLSWI